MSRLSTLTTAAERTLLAASVLLVLVIHGGGFWSPAWLIQSLPLAPDVQEVLPGVQIVAIAAWAVLGPGPLWVRLPTAPVLLVIWAVGWSRGDWAESRSLDELLLATGLTALLVLSVLRCCGLRIGKATPELTDRRLPQFSILGLIVLTTLVAAVLGALEWLRPTLRLESDLWMYEVGEVSFTSHHWLTSPSAARRAVMAAALAGAALAGGWSVLRPGLVWPRLMVAIAVAAVLGAYLVHVAGSDRGPVLGLSISLALHALLGAVSAWPLRLASARLTRRAMKFPFVPFRNRSDRREPCPAKLETVP